MSLSDPNSNGMVMPVSPMYGGYGNGAFGGTDGAWWLLVLLFALGGYGNNGLCGNGGGGSMPYLLNSQTQNDVNRGFDNLGLSNQLSAIQASLSNAEVANCNRAMDSMNQRFSDVLSLSNSLNNINSSLQQCCCENRAAVADLKYTVATEACADRAAVSDAMQRVLDQMAQDKLDAKNEKIADLERQLTMASLDAARNAQTAQIRAGQVAEIDAMYNRLHDCPVPTMPVYGSQPIFTCGNNSGCGCAGGFNGNF